jgi:predicted nuclease of predicted toxin-antitoxin system
VKILLNMNMSPRFAALLHVGGFACEHCSNIGAPDADDRTIMAFARINDVVVLTHDLDFGDVLAATNADKPSVVIVRVANMTPEFLAGPVVAGLNQCAKDLEQGALDNFDLQRRRVRLLPLNTRS